jgi:uncharacterized protein (DUF1697 family)
VRTYIQSGNVIFESRSAEGAIRSRLEKVLEARMGKKIDVIVRSAEEMRSVLSANPFTAHEPAKVSVFFLNEAPRRDLLEKVIAPGAEQLRPGKRELYVYYPEGMGQSKLKLPFGGAPATARNMNTVAKLVAMMGA